MLLVHAPPEIDRSSEGIFAEATVTETCGKDELIASVEKVGKTPEPNPRVTVVQAIPKSERSELAIDLATQAGADEFIAWQADRCIAKSGTARRHPKPWPSGKASPRRGQAVPAHARAFCSRPVNYAAISTAPESAVTMRWSMSCTKTPPSPSKMFRSRLMQRRPPS